MLLSLLLILVLGFIFGKLFTYLKIPNILGMLIAGIIVGPYVLDLLSSNLLNFSQEIRAMALIIILLKAGLSLKKVILKKVGFTALKLGLLPCLFEGLTIMLLAHFLLNFSLPEAGMLGFIIAAVSPAVVIPEILALKKQGYGEDKNIPTKLLAATSLDDVFAITIFMAFLGLGLTGDINLMKEMIGIPIDIFLGIMGGLCLGFIISKFYKNKFINPNNIWRLLILVSLSIAYYKFGNYIGIASLLGIIVIGMVIADRCSPCAKNLSDNLLKIWFFAQILLFTLVGAEVDISLILISGIQSIVIIFIGLIARSLGVWVAMTKTNLNNKEKLFCIFAYLPKATVQAAIGSIPLAMGFETGGIILAIAVLAILITAPLGSIAIKIGAPKLLNKAQTVK